MNKAFTDIQKEGFIAIVYVNNPPANTLSSACIAELRSVFQTLEHDPETRAVILTGFGRFFVAGADIKEFTEALGNQEQGMAMSKAGQDLCNEIEFMTKPVVAAINGPALGGGLELALSCHYRVATEDAILGLPELKLGLIPSFGGTQRLRRITNIQTALECILTSKQFNANEALKSGLVEIVVKKEEHLKTAKMIAHSFIDNKSMLSVKRAIECVVRGENEPFEDGLARECERFGELFLTEDAKEGVRAFVEKRKANFKHV